MMNTTYLSAGVRQLLSSVSSNVHKGENDLSMMAIRQCLSIEGMNWIDTILRI